jgi:hypothetical protein
MVNTVQSNFCVRQDMIFNCSYTELVNINDVQPNPKNPNKHPPDQIKRLAKLISYQGQRHPIIISKLSGMVVVGHGRLEAMQKLGWSQAAVDYQDFKDEAQEYAFVVSDNAISEWAELDKLMITDKLTELGPEFNDIELLGIKSMESLKDVFIEDGLDDFESGKKKEVKCPNCGEHFDPKGHEVF